MHSSSTLSLLDSFPVSAMISFYLSVGAKLEHMLALREEVEQEYAERMEELRNMYRDEMDAQNEKTCKDRERAHQMELSLSESLKVKREEAETFRTKSTELEARVTGIQNYKSCDHITY